MYGALAASALAIVPTIRFVSFDAMSEIAEGSSQKKGITKKLSKHFSKGKEDVTTESLAVA
jgi:hypothetical protein